MKIGIIDSGLGGFFVANSLFKKVRAHQYFFIGDNKNCPYGQKKTEDIFKLTCSMIDFLLSKEVDLIIIACNTISVTVLKQVKQKYFIKILDISNYNLKIALWYSNLIVLATDNTINSEFYQSYNCAKKYIKSSHLVKMIENGDLDGAKNYLLDIKKTNQITNQNILLGCTHFLGIQEVFKEVFSESYLVNGLNLLMADIKKLPKSNSGIKLYTTGDSQKFKTIVKKIIKVNIEIEKVKI